MCVLFTRINTYEVLEERNHGKSYWIKDVETNNVYSHAKDLLKLEQGALTTAMASAVMVESSFINIKVILKDPKSISPEDKHITLSLSCGKNREHLIVGNLSVMKDKSGRIVLDTRENFIAGMK